MYKTKDLPPELRRFYNEDTPKEPAIGTYLWPLRYFGEPYQSPDGPLPKEHTEIITSIIADSC